MIAKRLYSIDALRGVGALAIIFWHWQHFWAVRGTWQAVWSRSDEPAYRVFKPLYDQGWAAVDIFFAVSGFVFFWLYLNPVAKREIGAGKFTLQRFSRLYPLYVVTLLAATAMQFAFQSRTGNFFIFDANDWQHFVKSIFLVQNWLPPDELQSFNGPAWAVSIEVLLYVIFFAAVRFGLRGPLGAICFAIAGAIIFFWDGQIGRGIMGFFWGGAMFYVVRALVSHPRAKTIALFVIAAAITAWVVCVVEIYLGPIQALFAVTPFAKFLLAHAYPIFLQSWIFIVVPLTIVALALHEQLFSAAYQRLTFLGDISYSTYLIHFPMQLVLALLALRFGWMPADFMQGWVMLAFYAVLILLGWLSYTYFERPLSSFIRKREGLAPRMRWSRSRRGKELARKARQ
ncbi:MAG TPA: acyltransferase [Rhizomicrobium sp.]|nr:acyltransferase [Rhizomicrobium sp.]